MQIEQNPLEQPEMETIRPVVGPSTSGPVESSEPSQLSRPRKLQAVVVSVVSASLLLIVFALVASPTNDEEPTAARTPVAAAQPAGDAEKASSPTGETPSQNVTEPAPEAAQPAASSEPSDKPRAQSAAEQTLGDSAKKSRKRRRRRTGKRDLIRTVPF